MLTDYSTLYNENLHPTYSSSMYVSEQEGQQSSNHMYNYPSTVNSTEIMIAQALFSISPLFTVMLLHEKYVQALVFSSSKHRGMQIVPEVYSTCMPAM